MEKQLEIVIQKYVKIIVNGNYLLHANNII